MSVEEIVILHRLTSSHLSKLALDKVTKEQLPIHQGPPSKSEDYTKKYRRWYYLKDKMKKSGSLNASELLEFGILNQRFGQ